MTLLLLACSSAPEPLAVRVKGVSATADWSFVGDEAGARLGNSVAGLGDVNGDGLGDLGVGIPAHANGEVDEGQVLVFVGASGGPGPVANYSAESNVANDTWGTPVNGAGDVNGDGLADIVWGATSLEDAATGGSIHLRFGDPALAGAQWSYAPSSYLENGFGWGATGVGDVNGDGFGDLACGAPIPTDASTVGGRAFVFFGSATTPSFAWSVDTTNVGDLFGYSYAGFDVNGDSYDDLFVGAPGDDTAGEDTGTVFLFLGSATGPGETSSWQWSGAGVNDRAGRSLAAAGDTNGDGFPDLVVGGGQSGDPNRGHAWVFFGNGAGLDAEPAWTVVGDTSHSDFGVVAGGGDVNGDGYDDVAVGAPATDTTDLLDAGAFHLYLGGLLGPSPTPDLSFTGDRALASLGQSLDFLGDVNGDGGEDLGVGAPVYVDTVNGGAVFIYYGSGVADTGETDTADTNSYDSDTTTTDTPDDSAPPLDDTGTKATDRNCGCAHGRAIGGGLAGLAALLAVVARRRG